MLLKLKFLIFVLLCQLSLHAQQTLEQKLDSIYGHLAEENKPGFYAGITMDGEVIFSKGYGLANLEHQIPFVPSTVSDLGSVSKQMTAFAIAMLHVKGKLSIDEDIRIYLDTLPHLGHTVTLRHLIHHTSGIPDIYALHSMRGMRSGDYVSQDDAIRFLLRRPKVDFVPGSSYRYSNTGYMLLAEIIEKVTGEKFEHWMQENIFKPLGMYQTYIMDHQGEIFPGMADGYMKSNEGYYFKIYDNSTLQGGGGVYSTGEDMLKWIDNFRSHKLGGDTVFELLLQQATLNDQSIIQYAGGININKYRSARRYTHNGSSAGYRVKMSYYPEHKTGFIVKSNTPEIGYSAFDQMEDIILADLLGLSPVQDNNEMDAEKPSEIKSSLIPLEYEGSYYSNELDLTFKVEVSDSAIILSNFYYDLPILRQSGDDTFTGGNVEVSFTRGRSGRIVSMLVTEPRASHIEFWRKEH